MSVATHDLVFPALLARLLIAAVFLRAGVAKILPGANFESAVARYGLVPKPLVPVISRGLLLAEITAGFLLMAGIEVPLVALLTALLLVGFSGAMAINLARGRVISCGCGGSAPQPVTWRHAVLDLALAALSLLVALDASAAGSSRAQWKDLLPALLFLASLAVARSLAGYGLQTLRAARR